MYLLAGVLFLLSFEQGDKSGLNGGGKRLNRLIVIDAIAFW